MRRRKLDPEQAKALLAPVEVPYPYPGVAPKISTVFEEKKCDHCGGLHARNCPAVAEIEFHPDGALKRVVFWPRGQWADDAVIWLDDIHRALEGSG